MGLQERLMFEMKEALRAGQTLRLETIRLVRAAIKNAEIAKRRPLEESEVLEVIAREVRQREEVLDIFRQAGRQDLVDKTESELQLLHSYLPTTLSASELEALAWAAIQGVGAESVRDIGKVMKELMPRVRGRAEGKTVNDIVRRLLEEAAKGER